MTTTVERPARDLEATRQNIIAVATEHFTRKGYHGARIDEIASDTSTTKRMIYYCFGHKDGLFEACLTRALQSLREVEQSLHLDELEPRVAVARYVAETLRHHEAHPELAQLVRSENVLAAEHLREGDHTRYGHPVVETLDRVLARGREQGDFREGVDGFDLHIMVTSLATYRITNTSSVEALFGRSLRDPARLERDIDGYVRLALGWLDPAVQGVGPLVEVPGAALVAAPPTP